jgi:hypothetical protein
VFRAGSKTIKTWIVIYACFMAAIVFAESGTAMTLPEHGDLSPVLIETEAPALTIESVVRRSDI